MKSVIIISSLLAALVAAVPSGIAAKQARQSFPVTVVVTATTANIDDTNSAPYDITVPINQLVFPYKSATGLAVKPDSGVGVGADEVQCQTISMGAKGIQAGPAFTQSTTGPWMSTNLIEIESIVCYIPSRFPGSS